MSYSHILDQIFAERNARFELEGKHELREEWNRYNNLLRQVTEENIDFLNTGKVPNSKGSVIFWTKLSDEKKKKLIQDVYMAEELNQELKRNGKCTRASLVIGMMGDFKSYLRYVAALQNDTTRTLPIEAYNYAKWQEDRERKWEKRELRRAAKVNGQINAMLAETKEPVH